MHQFQPSIANTSLPAKNREINLCWLKDAFQSPAHTAWHLSIMLNVCTKTTFRLCFFCKKIYLSGHLRRPGFFPTREQRREKIAANETVSLSIFPAVQFSWVCFLLMWPFGYSAKWFTFPDMILWIGNSAPPELEEGTAAKFKDLGLSKR